MNNINGSNGSIKRYENIKLSDITRYGGHLGFQQNIKGRISSYLHWSIEYDTRNLAQYYIEWAAANPNKSLHSQYITDSKLINTLKFIGHNVDFNKISTRDAAHLALAFKNKFKKTLRIIFASHADLLNDSTVNCNINAFIAATKQKLDNDHVKNALRAPSPREQLANSLKLAISEGLIYDTSGSISGYHYLLFPALDAAFKTLTFGLLFEGFGGFFAACFVADLSVTIVKGLILGAYTYLKDGILAGSLKGLQEEWNKKVSDDNTFHPVIEAVISSTFIAFDWLIVDKLEQAAKAGSFLYTFFQYLSNFKTKYSVLYVLFTLKSQMQQNSLDLLAFFQASLAGVLRGACKNHLLDSITSPWKLPLASSLLSYTPFLSQVYLKEYWVKEIIAKTSIASTPLGLLQENPARLISALYFTREVVEILVNSISKSFEIVGIALLWPLLKKAYDYKSVSLILLATLFYLVQNK